jgi:hypothetical protein
MRRANMKNRGLAARPAAASSGVNACGEATRASSQTAAMMTSAAPAMAARSTPTDTPNTRYRPATIQ